MRLSGTALLALLATGSTVCGIAGQWVLVTALGPGAETDAYFIAQALPHVLLAVAAGPLLNVLVPQLAVEELPQRNRRVWALIAVLGGGSGALALLVALLAALLGFLAPSFSGQQSALVISLVQIHMLVFALSMVSLILSASEQAGGRFARVESATLAGTVVGLSATIVGVPAIGVAAAAWAGVARVIVQVAILLPAHGLPKRTRGAVRVARGVWTGMKPLIASGALAKTDPLIDRSLLATTSGGALSLFLMAQALFAAGIEVANRALIAPAVPGLARNAIGNPDAFRQEIGRLLVATTFVLVIAIAVLVAGGQDLLHVMFGYGRVSSEDVAQLWWIMLGLAGVPVGAAIGQIAASGFYARGDTTTPARLSITSFVCFTPLKVGAFLAFGLTGLVGACSAYYLTNALLLLLFLHRTLGRSDDLASA